MKKDIKVGDTLKLAIETTNPLWQEVDNSIVTKIKGTRIYYKKDGIEDWFHVFYIEEGDIIAGKSKRVKLTRIKLNPKQLKAKKLKIIKEIKNNPEFAKQFKNIEKEVNEWNDCQISQWK